MELFLYIHLCAFYVIGAFFFDKLRV